MNKRNTQGTKVPCDKCGRKINVTITGMCCDCRKTKCKRCGQLFRTSKFMTDICSKCFTKTKHHRTKEGIGLFNV